MKTFKTKAGTELPLIDLRGKDYLQVAHRLVWFREEHPDWCIHTEFVQLTENHAIAKASIVNDKGHIIATSHKCEDKRGFADFAEKAETGAIGRALAACGYGTQFAPELSEEHRVVDSPQHSQARVISAAPKPQAASHSPMTGGPTEKQIARLMAIAKENGWTEDNIKEYLNQMGLKSRRQLNRLQYDSLVEKIISFPKLKEDDFSDVVDAS
jgi:hypothetical protein